MKQMVAPLPEVGAPNISQTLEATGALEGSYRNVANAALQAPDDRKTEIYDQAGKISGIGKIVSIDWGAPKDLSRREQIILKGDKYERTVGSEQLVYAFISVFGYDGAAALVQLSAIAPNKERKEDVVAALASSTEERWRVTPPAGFRLKQAPQLKDIDVGPLTLRRSVSVEMDGSVTFLYQLENSRKRFTMAEIQKISDDWSHFSKEPAIRVDFVAEGSQFIAEGK
jgi:hypothetical protein